MPTCGKCNQENPAGSTFCVHCGNDFPAASTESSGAGKVRCPNCQAGNPEDAMFCSLCNEPLGGGQSQEASFAAPPTTEPPAMPAQGEVSDQAREALQGFLPEEDGAGGFRYAELLVGGGAAVICGIAWAVVVYVTGWEIGYAAIAVGAVVGIAVRSVARDDDVSTGVQAGGLAILGLIIGKALIVIFGLHSLALEEAMDDPDLYMAMIMEDIEPGLLDKDPNLIGSGTLRVLQEKAQARIAEIEEYEKRQHMSEVLDRFLDRQGFFGAMNKVVGFMDMLWFFLAVGAAFRIATGDTD